MKPPFFFPPVDEEWGCCKTIQKNRPFYKRPGKVQVFFINDD